MVKDDYVKRICQDVAALRKSDAIKPITATRIASGLLAETSGSGWRVIGITPFALSTLQQRDWKIRGAKLQRAHLFPRVETVIHILDNVEIFNGAQILSYWASRDMTVMCHSSENNKIAERTWLHLDNDDGTLFRSGNVGYNYALKREGLALQALWTS